jgi:hypothetical protein
MNTTASAAVAHPGFIELTTATGHRLLVSGVNAVWEVEVKASSSGWGPGQERVTEDATVETHIEIDGPHGSTFVVTESVDEVLALLSA